MATRRGIDRWLAMLSIAVLVAIGFVLVPAGRARGNEAPYAHANTTGSVGCGSTGLACPTWDASSTPGAASWAFDETKTATPHGGSALAAAKLQFVETDEADGMLASLTITGTLKAEITGVERADSRAQFSADFSTRATSLSVIGSASAESHGTDSIGSAGEVHVQLDCGAIDVQVTASGGFEKPDDTAQHPLTQTVDTFGENGVHACNLEVSMIAAGGTDRGADGVQHTNAIATLTLTLLAGPGPSPTRSGCALSGVVEDGDIVRDGHNNPMPDVPVELRRNDAIVGDAVITDAVGRYCVPNGAAEPGDYKLRATLADMRTNPPILETRYSTLADAAWVEVPVAEDDFGNQHKDISFGSTPDQLWLADVADIQYQGQRYLDWVLDTLEITPALLGHASIDAFSGGDTRWDDTNDISISAHDSVYAARSSPWTIGPAGIEWHELTHHLMNSLELGARANCPLQNPEGGWDNASTCASLDEGMALLLPAVAAADMRSSPEAPSFGLGGNLEDNGFYPWDRLILRDHTVWREPFAIAQLLWDVIDDTPLERASVHLETSPATPFTASDVVTLDARTLVHAMIDKKTVHIDEVFQAIKPVVPIAAISTFVDVDGDGTDIDHLAELLLIHGFHTVDNELIPAYSPGSTIGRTDHVPEPSAFLFERHRPLGIPGEAIRFTNAGSTSIAYTVDVVYPATSSHFEITVPPGGERLFDFEPPPYWRGVLPAGAALPACGGPDQRVVTMTVGGPGVPARTLDSCAYLHLVATSTGDAALSFGPVLPAASGGGLAPLAIAAIAAAALVLLALATFMRRRARASAPARPPDPPAA